MSIGPRLRRKRPSNDLDDYLDEIESRLFCVTPADKRCLLRDIKAHVKELTIDPRISDQFTGKYGISMDQLKKIVGEPSEIASMYIMSVKRKVPSWGLISVNVIIMLIFASLLFFGIHRISASQVSGIPNTAWSFTSGIGLVIIGMTSLGLSIYSSIAFTRAHILQLYLIFIYMPLSILTAHSLANTLTRNLYWTLKGSVSSVYSTIFIIDFIAIGLIGLFIYLRHYQSFKRNESHMV